jgi:hypothetical protein
MTLSLFFANIGIIAILMIVLPLAISLTALISFPGCIPEGSQFLIIKDGLITNGISPACRPGASNTPTVLIIILFFVVFLIGVSILSKVDISSVLSFAGISLFYLLEAVSMAIAIPFLIYIDYLLLGTAGFGVLLALRYG